MKGAMRWSYGDDDEDSSSTLDTDIEESNEEGSSDNSKKKNSTRNSVISSGTSSKGKTSQVDSRKRKSRGIDFEALSRHGYKGGPSILAVPPPKYVDDQSKDWSWSTGKESRAAQETEETFVERQRTRAAIVEGEQLTYAQTQKDKKNLSFSKKEKRKRDIGQASRGKNYVEEEKRLLRDSGVYSGFDS